MITLKKGTLLKCVSISPEYSTDPIIGQIYMVEYDQEVYEDMQLVTVTLEDGSYAPGNCFRYKDFAVVFDEKKVKKRLKLTLSIFDDIQSTDDIEIMYDIIKLIKEINSKSNDIINWYKG